MYFSIPSTERHLNAIDDHPVKLQYEYQLFEISPCRILKTAKKNTRSVRIYSRVILWVSKKGIASAIPLPKV